MRRSLPALPLVSSVVREERGAQANHAEGLDTKAGVILGFSGALVALGSSRPDTLVAIGQGAAAAAALLALWAFVPRRLPVPDVKAARDYLLPLDADAAAIELLDAEIRMIVEGRRLVQRKSFRLKLSMALLVVAMGLTVLEDVME